MIAHYLKTSLRHAAGNKLHTALRTLGLSIALFCFLVAALYLSWQLSFDRFHEHAENIYRVNGRRDEGGHMKAYAVVPPGLGPALSSSFAEVEAAARISLPGRQLLKYKDKLQRPNGFVEADPSVFDMFSISFLQGDRHALDQPASVVLTATLATQLFGEEDPMGKPLIFVERFNRVLTVTAVVRDFPANSHFDFRAITGRYDLLDSVERRDADTWNLHAVSSLYLRLKEGADPGSLGARIEPLLRQNLPHEEDGSEKNFAVFLQPVTSIYFEAPLAMEFSRKGNQVYLYGFFLLSSFLLVIALVSYVNLSLAELGARIRQMGVRRALGAERRHVVAQVAVEGMLHIGTGLALGLLALYFLFPEVKRQLEPNLSLAMLGDVRLVIPSILALVILVAGVSIGPSIVMTRNAASGDLRGELTSRNQGSRLLLLQVTVALFCLAVTWVMSLQMRFIQHTDLGYDRHQVVALLMPDRYPVEKAGSLKSKIAALAGVSGVSYSYYMITGGQYQKGGYQVEIGGEMKPMMVNEAFIDHDFLPTMGIPLVVGRNFEPGNSADAKTAFVVNEAAVREFGWDRPLGKSIRVGQGNEAGAWQGTVVGVTRDFNIRPLRERIEPLIMRLQFDEWPGYWLNVKVSGPMEETIQAIRSAFEEVLPGFVADYRLLDDMYERQYQEDIRAFTAIRFGTLMIALISILGVFSLSMYLSMRRTREFGIRKVLGATASQIIALHLARFVRVAILSVLLALPLSAWLMSRWLNSFVYRASVGVYPYVMGAGIGIVVLLLAAGYAALRAARANPVETIRVS